MSLPARIILGILLRLVLLLWLITAIVCNWFKKEKRMEVKKEKKPASNILGSIATTAAGAGLAGLNLWANGMGTKQIAISVAAMLLGAFAKDPNKE